MLNFLFEVCYRKGLVTKYELHDKPCNICQQLKKRKNPYGRLSTKKISELKPWDTLHVDLVGPLVSL